MTIHWQQPNIDSRAMGPAQNSFGSYATSLNWTPGISKVGLRRLCVLLLSTWSLILLHFFVEGNHFPAAWHPDEPSKVAQVLGSSPNFHHPQLLLMATRLAVLFQSHPTAEDVVVAGRWVSAVAAVAAVDLLALSALLLDGETAALLTALLVGTNPLLYGLAHYMKEDAVYVFGLSAFLLSLIRYDREPSRNRLAQMAVAVGIAMSGKYLGLITLPLALGIVLWRHRDNWVAAVKPCAMIVGLASLVFIAFDAPLLISFHRFFTGFKQEIKHVVLTNHGGLYRPFFSPFYIEGLIQTYSPLAIGAYGLWLLRLFRSQQRMLSSEFVIGMLPIAYVTTLQTSPVKLIRYELPVVLIISMLAAVFLAGLFMQSKRPFIWVLGGLSIAGILGDQAMGLSASRAAILNDSRAQMADWIKSHFPADAVILEGQAIEDRAPLTASGKAPIKVVIGYYAADAGSLDSLRAAGVTHVLTSDLAFGRLFNATLQVDDRDRISAVKVASEREFYTSLFETETLVHYTKGSTPIGTFFSPGLWLFDIRQRQTADWRVAPRKLPSSVLLQD